MIDETKSNDAPIEPTPSNWHRENRREAIDCSVCGAKDVAGWAHRLLPDGETIEVIREPQPGPIPDYRYTFWPATFWQRRYLP